MINGTFWNIIKWLPAICIVIGAFFMGRSCYNDIIDGRIKQAKDQYDDSIAVAYAEKHPLDMIDVDEDHIVLYALSNDINKDTSVTIVKDYFNILGLYAYEAENADSVINVLSTRYNKPKKYIAGLILNYRYSSKPE